MKELENALKDLENERNCIIRCQESIRQDIENADGDELVTKVSIYNKNKEELKDVNKKIEIVNNAIDIIKGIGV